MLTDLKDLANILFFVVVGTVTILTYLQARKTLFSPIRTEVFKLQLKIFEEVLSFFQNKTETDFIEACDLNLICRLNAYQMADSFIHNFYGSEIKIDEEKQKKAYEPLTRGIISKKHADKVLKPISADTAEAQPQIPDAPITNPALILSNWQDYEHEIIGYTDKLSDLQAELKRLSISPILPTKIRKLIEEFNGIILNNLIMVGTTVTEFSQKMPKLIPRTTDIQKFNVAWITNTYNENRQDLEPKAREILEEINKYLKIENLMK